MACYTPIDVPNIISNDEGALVLTPDQEEKRKHVLEHFSKDDYRLPDEEKGELMEEEKFWLTNDCILRYLRATKWVQNTAIERLEATLRWRREYGFYGENMTAVHVEPESVTGKEVVFGYDTKGRPALYMFPSRQNTAESPRQLHFAVWMLERGIDLMGPGVESLDLLINFGDRGKNPSLGTAHKMLNILQSHYPERLGLALIINVPFLVNAFFKLIMPFVDPITRAKVKFNPSIFDDGHMTPDMVMKEWWGGEREFIWDHTKYWPALVSMCEERRTKQFERWRALGGKVGESELAIKGGEEAASKSQQMPSSDVEKRPVENATVLEVPVVEITPA